MPPTPPPFAQQMAQRQTLPPASSAQPVESPPVPVLYAQLVNISTVSKSLIYNADSQSTSQDSCTIFAGASLSVDNNFSFYRGRLALENEAIPAFSVVTEHHEQTLLFIPNDVPEPNMPQYQRHLDDALIQLSSTLEGQLVALFTLHAALRSSYAAIKPILEARGILVLAQGVDGSPRQLWQIFQHQERIVLLGTGSFWDSIEEVSRTPICTVLTRLPMPVLNDPPVAARAEHYSDQLHQLTVPVASLRVRRVLNRLAWSDTQR